MSFRCEAELFKPSAQGSSLPLQSMHVVHKFGVRNLNKFAAHITSQLEHGVGGSCSAVAVEQRLQASSLVQLCQQDGPWDGGMPQQGDPGCLQAELLGMAAVGEHR